MDPEFVRPADGPPVTLSPCPSWCAESPHLADEVIVHADDGYSHYGPEVTVSASGPLEDYDADGLTMIRAFLKSWTHPLGAEPGPARVELNLGTEDIRTDVFADLTPDAARALGRALISFADMADRDAPQATPGAQ